MFAFRILLMLVPFLTLANASPRNYLKRDATATIKASSILTRTATLAAPQDTETAFSLIADRSGSSIQLQSLNASTNNFWIGKYTSASCPTPPVTGCPPVYLTVLQMGSNGTCHMDVEVPGGQTVYVARDGALSFTVANGGTIPSGSFTTGFGLTSGRGQGTFSFKGEGATGFVACPTPSSDTPWQIFADITGFVPPMGDAGACLGFTALGVEYTDYGAWQYD